MTERSKLFSYIAQATERSAEAATSEVVRELTQEEIGCVAGCENLSFYATTGVHDGSGF